MIKKPSIIITSIGRTGTKFFSKLFKQIVPNGTTLHDPHVLSFSIRKGKGIKHLLEQLQESGIENLVIRKALGRWDLTRLSDARVKEELGYEETVEEVLRQRKKFVTTRPGSVYIESSAGYYGLIDVLRDVYERQAVAYMVRDGRDWVQSWMNWGEMYGKGRLRSLITHTWPEASQIPDDPYSFKWKSMSRFEKLCWAWASLNNYALQTIQKNPNARVFHFENIFSSHDRYEHLAELVRFLTAIVQREETPSDLLEGWLERKIHGSTGDFPSWRDWPKDQRRQFRTICGPLMDQLGYEVE